MLAPFLFVSPSKSFNCLSLPREMERFFYQEFNPVKALLKRLSRNGNQPHFMKMSYFTPVVT